MKPATSNLACSWRGLAEAHHQIASEEKAHHIIVRRGKSKPQILGFPYNISGTAEASNFIIGTLLRFAKAHHEVPHRRKSKRGPGL